MLDYLLYFVEGLGLFVTATFVFDVIHYTLHRFQQSRLAPLRWLGNLHQAHHDYFDRELRFHEESAGLNLTLHIVPEYSTQMAATALGLFVLPWQPVAGVMIVFTWIFVGVLFMRGKDKNHVAFEVLPATHEAVRIEAPYHSLHHVHPDNYFSSYTRLFDVIMGTGCQLAGKRIALTGASGAFGAPLRVLLEIEGAAVTPLRFGQDFSYADCSGCDDVLRHSDVLVLCHGSKLDHAMEANCETFVALIERFKSLTGERRFPVEVWAVGSEIECHGAFGDANLQVYLDSKRAFARHARRYFWDRSVLYRHIVPSAFTSPMGRGLMSGQAAVRMALFLIRRGFRYVPVTYTGVAFVNFLKFLLRPAA